MKSTTVSYCQVCGSDFENKQRVYYVVIDNSIVCEKCAHEASKLTDNIQIRKYEE